MRIEYEWVVEELDDEGDILDVNHWDEADLPAALDYAQDLRDHGKSVDVGLVRYELDTHADEPDETSREYVYADPDGALPVFFGSGVKVPLALVRMWEENRR